MERALQRGRRALPSLATHLSSVTARTSLGSPQPLLPHSATPVVAPQRMVSLKNTLIVLHPDNSDVVALDMFIEYTGVAASGQPTPAPLVIQKNMAREEHDTAAKTIDRIRLLFAPPRPKGQASKKVKKEELLASCPSLRIMGVPTEVTSKGAADDAGLIELDTTLENGIFWKAARILYVADVPVCIRYNIPTIVAMAAPSQPIVGLPVVIPSISVLFTKEEDIYYEWGRHEGTGDCTFSLLSTSASFVPGPELIGQPLILRATADRTSGLWTQLTLPPVAAAPPEVGRWEETRTPVQFPAFRVVTYNILYDDFCTSKSSKTKIYPFATDDVLDLEKRKVRLVREMLAYNADIFCLQECGKHVFQTFLLPSMKFFGFDGVYMNKSGSVQEGCGFLFRTDRFELRSSSSIPLNYATMASTEPDLAEQVSGSPELKEALANVTSIAAYIILCVRNSEREVVVGNTHLFYHANACHIRILQTYMLMKWLYTAVTEKELENEEIQGVTTSSCRAATPRPLVLCGDFNCTNTTGAYRLLTTGQVESWHHSWEKGKLFWWGCARLLGYSGDQVEELIGISSPTQQPVEKKSKLHVNPLPSHNSPTTATNSNTTTDEAKLDGERIIDSYFKQSLLAPLRLTDAYGRTDPSLPWTKYTLTFREVIDYILFTEESIDVLRTIPIPSEAELSENYALPNEKFPSDHVALIADLAFRT